MTASRIHQTWKVPAIRALQPPARPGQARHMAGFTLVELVITLSIAAILLTIGIPSLQSIIATNRAAGLTNELSSALQLARSEAVSRGRSVTVCKSDVTQDEPTCSTSANWQNGWLIFVDQNGNDSFDTGDLRLKVGQPSISHAVITGDTKFVDRVRYLPTGASKDSGVITICVPPEQRTLNISSTGRIKIEKATCS